MGAEQHEAEQEDLFLGTRLGGYEIERLIGRGAMGNVYRARQISLERPVAIKLLISYLASQPELLARFFREAKTAASINHNNLVQVYDFGEVDGTYFYVMELIDGLSLGEYLRRGEAFVEAECVGIARQAVAALQAAHKCGIIHRDVKPDNLMLSKSGQIKLSDLGLARLMDVEDNKSLTMTGMSIGTPFYISPEQVRGERAMDHRTDFYGLGATLYHLATGHVPFEGETSAVVMARHLQDAIPWARDVNPALSDGFSTFIHRMMAKSPSDRPASHEEILAELDHCESGQSMISARAATATPRFGTLLPPVASSRKGWLRRVAGFGAATVAMAAMGAGALFLLHTSLSQSKWAPVARTAPPDSAPVGVHPLTLDEGPQINAIFAKRNKLATAEGKETRVPFDARTLKHEWLGGGSDEEPALTESNGLWLHWNLADIRKIFQKLPASPGKAFLPQIILQNAQLVLVFRAITCAGQLQVFFSAGEPQLDLSNDNSVEIVNVEPGRAQVVSLNITDRFKSLLLEQKEGSWLLRFTPKKEGMTGSAVLAEMTPTERLFGPRVEIQILDPKNREKSWWPFGRPFGRADARMTPGGAVKPPKNEATRDQALPPKPPAKGRDRGDEKSPDANQPPTKSR